jgi:hypothetical protein
MAKHTLHYPGGEFALDDEEAEQVAEAIRLAAAGNGKVVTFREDLEDYSTTGGPSVTHQVLFGPGIAMYLTTTTSVTD